MQPGPALRLLATVLALAIGIAACTGARIKRTAEVDAPIDLSPYETCAWLGGSGGEAVDPELDGMVRQAIEKALPALGLRLIDSGEADLAVSYRIDITKKIRNNPPDLFMYAAEEWEYGTLTIELREGATLEPAWRGSATEELRRTRVTVGSIDPELRPTREERHWRLDTMVGVILGSLRS